MPKLRTSWRNITTAQDDRWLTLHRLSILHFQQTVNDRRRTWICLRSLCPASRSAGGTRSWSLDTPLGLDILVVADAAGGSKVHKNLLLCFLHVLAALSAVGTTGELRQAADSSSSKLRRRICSMTVTAVELRDTTRSTASESWLGLGHSLAFLNLASFADSIPTHRCRRRSRSGPCCKSKNPAHPLCPFHDSQRRAHRHDAPEYVCPQGLRTPICRVRPHKCQFVPSRRSTVGNSEWRSSCPRDHDGPLPSKGFQTRRSGLACMHVPTTALVCEIKVWLG